MDPHTFSEGTWTLQAHINSLQIPSEEVLGSIGTNYELFGCLCSRLWLDGFLGPRLQKSVEFLVRTGS